MENEKSVELINTDKEVPKQEFIEDQLILLTASIYEKFRQTDHPADCMALYVHYYYTAKWQKTNLTHSTTSYSAKALKWSLDRVRKTKKVLTDLGLIEDIIRKSQKGKIVGHYIKIKYIFKNGTVQNLVIDREGNHTMENPRGGETHSVENPEPNALSTSNVNALSTSTKTLKVETTKQARKERKREKRTSLIPSSTLSSHSLKKVKKTTSTKYKSKKVKDLVEDDEDWAKGYKILLEYFSKVLIDPTRLKYRDMVTLQELFMDSKFDFKAYCKWYKETKYPTKSFNWGLFMYPAIIDEFNLQYEDESRYLKTTTNLRNSESFQKGADETLEWIRKLLAKDKKKKEEAKRKKEKENAERLV